MSGCTRRQEGSVRVYLPEVLEGSDVRRARVPCGLRLGMPRPAGVLRQHRLGQGPRRRVRLLTNAQRREVDEPGVTAGSDRDFAEGPRFTSLPGWAGSYRAGARLLTNAHSDGVVDGV